MVYNTLEEFYSFMDQEKDPSHSKMSFVFCCDHPLTKIDSMIQFNSIFKILMNALFQKFNHLSPTQQKSTLLKCLMNAKTKNYAHGYILTQVLASFINDSNPEECHLILQIMYERYQSLKSKAHRDDLLPVYQDIIIWLSSHQNVLLDHNGKRLALFFEKEHTFFFNNENLLQVSRLIRETGSSPIFNNQEQKEEEEKLEPTTSSQNI